MRHTRYKQIRKTLSFYERCIPGFPRCGSTSGSTPQQQQYHIILDGTFIVHSYQYHTPIIERIYKLLLVSGHTTSIDYLNQEEDFVGTGGVANTKSKRMPSNTPHRHGNSNSDNNSMTKNKRIQFYICQSTIDELQAIYESLLLDKKTNDNKKKRKLSSSTQVDTTDDVANKNNHDGSKSSSNTTTSSKGNEDDGNDSSFIKQALDFCLQQQQRQKQHQFVSTDRGRSGSTSSINTDIGDVIVLPNSCCDSPPIISATTVDNKPSQDNSNKIVDNRHDTMKRKQKVPQLSMAASDIWHYLSSATTTSSSSLKYQQHYMIATQDPTLLYYCRHHHPTATATTPTTTTPIPILRYNIPTIVTTQPQQANTKNKNVTSNRRGGCGVLVLDPPTSQFMKRYQYQEHTKWFTTTATTTTSPLDDTDKKNTISKNEAIQPTRNSSDRYNKPKKAKGPNPLSCKKKTKSTSAKNNKNQSSNNASLPSKQQHPDQQQQNKRQRI